MISNSISWLKRTLFHCFRYSGLLKAVEVNSSDELKVDQIRANHHEFGRLTMDVLVEMIQSSLTNASKNG